MPSTSDSTYGGDQQFEPGAQVLASLSSMDSALSVLPPGAAENLLLVSPDSPAQVESDLTERGIDVRKVGVIPISGSKTEYDGPMWTTDAIGPSDLTGISMAFSRALEHLEPGSGWFVFENLNVPLLYADERQVYRLVDHLLKQARERRVRGVYTVAREAVGDRTYAKLQNRFDTTYRS